MNGGFNLDIGGIWVGGRRVASKDITDGLSHTLLIGEKTIVQEMYDTGTELGDRATIWGRTGFGDTDRIQANCYVRTGFFAPYQDRNRECLGTCHEFGSAHVGLWNTVFCDGSVQTLSYNIPVGAFQAMTGTNDGVTIQLTGRVSASVGPKFQPSAQARSPLARRSASTR